jgi:hypothetical protein
MGGPGAFLQALQKSATHPRAAFVFYQAWEKSDQSVIKTGEGVGRVVFQFTNVYPRLDHWPVGPYVGPTQVGYPKNGNAFLVRHGSLWMARSTDLVLSALCILAHLLPLLACSKLPRVVSSGFIFARCK